MNTIYKYLLGLAILISTATTGQAQQFEYAWKIGAHGGIANYYGDLSHQFFDVHHQLKKPLKSLDFIAYGLSVEHHLSSTFGLRLMATKSQIAANDRTYAKHDYYDRALNVETNIWDAAVLLHFYTDNGWLFGTSAVVSPYLMVGFGASHYTTFADLYTKQGQRYHYWSDNTIRDIAENSPATIQSQILEQDGGYETRLQRLNTEGVDYNNWTWNIPFGLGLKIRFSPRWHLHLEALIKYTGTDYLDDVKGDYLSSYSSTEQAYAANPSNRADQQRGYNPKSNDWYSFLGLSVHYSFGWKAKNFKAPIIYTTPSNTVGLDSKGNTVDTSSFQPDFATTKTTDKLVVDKNTTTIDSLLTKEEKDSNKLVSISTDSTTIADTLLAEEEQQDSSFIFMENNWGDDLVRTNSLDSTQETVLGTLNTINSEYNDLLNSLGNSSSPEQQDLNALQFQYLNDKLAEVNLKLLENKLQAQIDKEQLRNDFNQQLFQTAMGYQNEINRLQWLFLLNNKSLDSAGQAALIKNVINVNKKDSLATAQKDSIQKNSIDSIALTELKSALDSTLIIDSTLLDSMVTIDSALLDSITKPRVSKSQLLSIEQRLSNIEALLKNNPQDSALKGSWTEMDEIFQRFKQGVRTKQTSVATDTVSLQMEAKLSKLQSKIKILEQELTENKQDSSSNSSATAVPIDKEKERLLEEMESLKNELNDIENIRKEEQDNNSKTTQQEFLKTIQNQKQTIKDLEAEVNLLKEGYQQQVLKDGRKKDKQQLDMEALLQKEQDELKNMPALEIEKIKMGNHITKIYFANGATQLGLQGKETLNTLINYIQKYPNIQLKISGFASKSGNATTNLILSKQRALSVTKYLIAQGIVPSRTVMDYFGEDKSQTDAETERKVEIQLFIK